MYGSNSAGLAAIGWDRHTPDPHGGWLVRNRRGELTGEVREAAFFRAEAGSRTALLADGEDAWLAEAAEHGRALARAGIVRVADALDMAKGRSRIPFEHGRVSIHSLSAAAIDSVQIGDGESAPIAIEIAMNNSSGVYQVDELLKAKLRGSGLEPYVEVVARIDTEAEKSLIPLYRLEL